MGKVSTHCALYAQLIVNGQEKGVNVFIVQIRDENHQPLPGVEAGFLGNKMGDNSNDTGYLILKDVRIPRENMLMKYNQVSPEGFYTSDPSAAKFNYSTMLFTRANFVRAAAGWIAKAAIISVRYNAVRE